MLAAEVDTSLTELSILARTVFDVILRSVLDLPLMDTHRPVAMHAPDAAGRRTDGIRDRDLHPSPLSFAADHELPTLLATEHQVMRHVPLLWRGQPTCR